MNLTKAQVLASRKRIASIATRTSLKPSLALSRDLGRTVSLKMETLQATGAFKLRGASNAILSLPNDVKSRGVVTASSGNHGRALAYVARELGIPADICLSNLVPSSKVEAIKSLGATVHVGGKDQDAAMAVAHDIDRGIQRNRAVVYTPGFWRFIMLIIRNIPDRIFGRLEL